MTVDIGKAIVNKNHKEWGTWKIKSVEPYGLVISRYRHGRMDSKVIGIQEYKRFWEAV